MSQNIISINSIKKCIKLFLIFSLLVCKTFACLPAQTNKDATFTAKGNPPVPGTLKLEPETLNPEP
jgi:hypothetical protein